MLALLLVAGCGGAPAPPPADPLPAVPEASGPARFAYLEDRLLGASRIELGFHITADGAINSTGMGGRLVVAPGNRVRLEESGTLRGTPTNVDLVSDGTEVALRGERQPAPPALGEALQVGFSRMGVMHDLLRIIDGSLPDHAEGGVRDWVRVDEVEADEQTLRFRVIVGGQPWGRSTLRVDPVSGLPVGRETTAQVEEGEVRIVEEYSALTLDGPGDPADFDFPF